MVHFLRWFHGLMAASYRWRCHDSNSRLFDFLLLRQFIFHFRWTYHAWQCRRQHFFVVLVFLVADHHFFRLGERQHDDDLVKFQESQVIVHIQLFVVDGHFGAYGRQAFGYFRLTQCSESQEGSGKLIGVCYCRFGFHPFRYRFWNWNVSFVYDLMI